MFIIFYNVQKLNFWKDYVEKINCKLRNFVILYLNRIILNNSIIFQALNKPRLLSDKYTKTHFFYKYKLRKNFWFRNNVGTGNLVLNEGWFCLAVNFESWGVVGAELGPGTWNRWGRWAGSLFAAGAQMGVPIGPTGERASGLDHSVKKAGMSCGPVHSQTLTRSVDPPP